MATDSAFYATPRIGAGLLPATADTSRTAPTNVTTLLTAATAPGTMVFEIAAMGVGTTVSGVLNIFLYDGTTYHLRDEMLVGAVTANTTTVSWSMVRTYTNLIVPNTWSLRVSGEIAGNQSLVKVIATGADG